MHTNMDIHRAIRNERLSMRMRSSHGTGDISGSSFLRSSEISVWAILSILGLSEFCDFRRWICMDTLSKACLDVIVDYSYSLHECIDDSRTDEAHTSAFEVFRDRKRNIWLGRKIRDHFSMMDNGERLSYIASVIASSRSNPVIMKSSLYLDSSYLRMTKNKKRNLIEVSLLYLSFITYYLLAMTYMTLSFPASEYVSSPSRTSPSFFRVFSRSFFSSSDGIL